MGMLITADKNYPDASWVIQDVGTKEAMLPPKGIAPESHGIAFQWSVFCHIVDPARWERAVENLRSWATDYVVYADKLDGKLDAPHLWVHSKKRLIELMHGWELVCERPYTVRAGEMVVDTLTALVFKKRTIPVEVEPLEADEAACDCQPGHCVCGEKDLAAEGCECECCATV
jgi:hypothetical protein